MNIKHAMLISLLSVNSIVLAVGEPHCKKDTTVTVINKAPFDNDVTVFSASAWSPMTKTIKAGKKEKFAMKKGGFNGFKVKHKDSHEVAVDVPGIGIMGETHVETLTETFIDEEDKCGNSTWVINAHRTAGFSGPYQMSIAKNEQ